MKTSTIGQTIDNLLTIAQANFADPWVVCDGPWQQTQNPERFVAIGLAALSGDENTAGGVQSQRAMGQPLTVDEDYSVVCEIFCWTGNTDNAAQKLVRDEALAALAVFETSLRTDGNVGGTVLAGGAFIDQIDVMQLDPEIDRGRMCRIHFNVHVKNVLTL